VLNEQKAARSTWRKAILKLNGKKEREKKIVSGVSIYIMISLAWFFSIEKKKSGN